MHTVHVEQGSSATPYFTYAIDVTSKISIIIISGSWVCVCVSLSETSNPLMGFQSTQYSGQISTAYPYGLPSTLHNNTHNTNTHIHCTILFTVLLKIQ